MTELAAHQVRRAVRQRFCGDRRLYSIEGPLTSATECEDNPESLCVGGAVHLPRSMRAHLGIDDGDSFVLAEIRRFGFGSMGFCEVEGQPGQGVWVRLRYLTHSEWHTFEMRRSRPAQR
jgi:hypothetical protein